jgi:hypothetical protein
VACGIFDPIGCLPLIPDPVGIPSTLVNGVLNGLATAIAAGVKTMVGLLASWILVPSNPVCPTATPSGSGPVAGGWVTQCQQAASPAATLRGYVLPITILVAVIGLLWQGIVMAVTRKGEPLLQVVRGLWNSALWGAVGIAGTQLALNAGDSFANWVLDTALHTSNPGTANQTFTTAIGAMLVAQLPAVPIIGILAGIVITFVVIIQIVLLIFRGAAVSILAGLLQLAASGSFTRATSTWIGHVTRWMAALIAYKPMAALIYATGLAFMSDQQHAANFVIGIAVLALSVIALPAMMKFFSWTVGAVQSGSSMGMFGAAAAAGMHASSSLRGLGGNSAADHSRYMDANGPGNPSSGSPRPTGSGSPSGSGGPGAPGGAPAGAVIDGTASSSVPASSGTSSAAASAGPSATASAGLGTSGGAAAGGAGAAADGAGTAGAAGAGAAAATGPAAPIVLGAVVAGQTAATAAKAASSAATDAMGGA